MIYVIGLPEAISLPEVLCGAEYFGQYGPVQKIAVNFDKTSGHQRPINLTASAYVTYTSEVDAAVALIAVQECSLDKSLLKASFGMTKYCSYYLAGMECQNIDCAFYHGLASEKDCVWKVDSQGRREPVQETQRGQRPGGPRGRPEPQTARVRGQVLGGQVGRAGRPVRAGPALGRPPENRPTVRRVRHPVPARTPRRQRLQKEPEQGG